MENEYVVHGSNDYEMLVDMLTSFDPKNARYFEYLEERGKQYIFKDVCQIMTHMEILFGLKVIYIGGKPAY